MDFHKCELEIESLKLTTRRKINEKDDFLASDLSLCTFTAKTPFLTLQDDSVVNFTNMKIFNDFPIEVNKRTTLRMINVKPEANSPKDSEWDFSNFSIDQSCEFVFIDCDVRYANFFGWDLRDTEIVNFKDCTWNTDHYSQLVAHKERALDGNQLEGMYRALQNRYEEEGNKPQSGDFHYWEQTLRFKRLWQTKICSLEFWFLFLYGSLAGYGEKLFHMVLVWLGILLSTPYFIISFSDGLNSSQYGETLLTSIFTLLLGGQNY